jgi:hypothetical protein
MSALDLCSLAAPAPKASANGLAGVAGGSTGKSSSGDDFSQMMDQALTPGDGKKSAPTHLSTARKNGAAPRAATLAGLTRPVANASLEATSNDSSSVSSVDSGAAKTDKPMGKPAAATSDQPTAGSEVGALPPVPTSLETLPVFLRLSFDAALSAKVAATTSPETGSSASQSTDAVASLSGALSVGGALGMATPQGGETAGSPALPMGAGLILTGTLNSAFASAATVANSTGEATTTAASQSKAPESPESPVSAAGTFWLKGLTPVADTAVKAADPLALPQPTAAVPVAQVAPEPMVEAKTVEPTLTPATELVSPKDVLLEAGAAGSRASLSGAETENAGTGVALGNSPMKKNENTNKVAGLSVKVLPGAADELAREKNLPIRLVVASVPSTENRMNDNRSNDLNLNLPTGNASAVASPGTLNLSDLPSLGEARLRAVERTHEMVSLHAMRLVESKSDSLQVTIKPAVGTELSLELKQRNGVIEAQVTLQRGDHAFLSEHWPELQQRLEQRGIKLSELGSEAGFTGGNPEDARRTFTPEEEAMQASAFAEFATAGGAGGASARHAADYDGWESWA